MNQKVVDVLHKVSSVFAVLAGLGQALPQLSSWQSLFVTLAAALGGVGVAGSVVNTATKQ